jgi:hypothetical protein
MKSSEFRKIGRSYWGGSVEPGLHFFDEDFQFHDGQTGEKLFLVLGTLGSVSLVAKTTSKQHGRGLVFGCQPKDRFHNFYLPPGSCYLKANTWICLDEFYELEHKVMLQKRFDGKVKPVCDLIPALLRQIQDCALISLDLTPAQHAIVLACLASVS